MINHSRYIKNGEITQQRKLLNFKESNVRIASISNDGFIHGGMLMLDIVIIYLALANHETVRPMVAQKK